MAAPMPMLTGTTHRSIRITSSIRSPWPIVGSIAAGALATGAVLFMHGHGWELMALGFIAVLLVMAVWWRDVIREATFLGFHNPVVQLGMRYGMALFIASEVMFFSAFFWAFFTSSLFPVGGTWPPQGIHPFDPFEFPFLNTLILLLSGTTVTWAHHSIIHGNRKGLIQGLALTVLLGMSFTALQALEYSEAAFHYSGNIYGATFFMATGFHGFHVIVGTIFLAVCLWRATQGHFAGSSFLVSKPPWYWHFVDVVWLFLFRLHLLVGHGERFAARGGLSAADPGNERSVTSAPYYAPVSPLRAAFGCRCPRCGEGSLFTGLLTVRAACPVCGLDLSAADAGDGPAVFVIFALGFIVVGLAAIVEIRFSPPIWLHMLLWTPLILVGAIALLRPMKAGLIALQYRHRQLGSAG